MAKHINKPIEIWIYNRVKYDEISVCWDVYCCFSNLLLFLTLSWFLSYLFSRVFFFFYLHLCFILWQISSYRHNSYYFSGFRSFACKFFYCIGILKTLWCFQATNVYKLSFIATTHKHTRKHNTRQQIKTVRCFRINFAVSLHRFIDWSVHKFQNSITYWMKLIFRFKCEMNEWKFPPTWNQNVGKTEKRL